ncbi:MAG TPA: ATP-binding protein [Anaerolineales bacterium]|nr:ATP-binding protein [Anaerolineales bacterium]
MSKRKQYLNRLEKTVSDAFPPVPDPVESAPFLNGDEDPHDSHANPEPAPELDVEGGAGQDQLGWEDYLNSIDRGERIGYCYNLDDIGPLAMPLPIAPDTQITSKGTNVLLATPLLAGDQLIGSLQLERSSLITWSEQETQVVITVAKQIVQHIENLRLLSQAEQYRRDAEQALRRLTREGWQHYVETTTTLPEGYTYDGNLVTPLDVGNIPTQDDSLIEKPALTQWIRIRNEPIGQLTVERADDEAKTLTTAVAERLSLHLEALRLLEETEKARQQLDRRAAELETVARVSTAAATILDPQTLLQSVVDLTKYSFSLYHAQVFLLEGDMLVLKAGSGKIGQRMIGEGISLWLDQEQSAVTSAAREKQVIIIDDTQTQPDFVRSPFLPEERSEMAVPMIVADELKGIFNVVSNLPNRFSQDDVRIYTTLAAQVAVALRNAELYAEQMAAVERLRELDHLKTSFLANMSHELRTPLNSILGFTQVILEEIDGPLTPEMVSDLKLVEKNGQHLLKLISDVLDMAKIEAGRMNLSMEEFDLMELLQEVLESMGSLARDKSLYLTLEAVPDHTLFVTADMFRLRQIIINLVGNAVKFTETGGVTLSVEKTTQVIRIAVSDTGLGIPPNQLESVFEAFTQVDTTTTRKVGGTGLGLPISRRLVEMHGGKLWAESTGTPGEGSIFYLELPVEPNPTAIN